jgi:Fe-S oxidoreductase
MIGISAPGWLMLVSLALLVLGALWRARRWFAGRPAPLDWLGLLKLPRRYLVDLHHVVARDRYAAGMHMLAAGGFVAAVLLILLVHVLGIGSDWLAGLLLLACVIMALGALMVAMRRWETRTAHLSHGAFDRLPYALFAFGFFYALASAPQAGLGSPIHWHDIGGFVLLVIGAWGCWELFAGMSVGPMRHALAGALHLAFHPRAARFDAARESALRPLALDAPRLGSETPADFRWNQLLSFDACVQCGRCEAACPAFAAEQPLNPKKLIQDLANALGPGTDSRYAGNPHPGRAIGQARGGRALALIGVDAMIHPDTLWSCTTCRACVYECPMMIEHVDAVIDLRRFQTLELGATPGKAADALAELRAADNPGGRPPAGRLDWAADLALPVLVQKREADVLLWLGDGAFELRNQRTLRALVKLLRRAAIDFAVLGEEERDCGDLARRLGDEATFQDLARRNIATLANYRFARIVTTDPHAFHSLKNEYPAFGGRYDVVHHTTFLARLIAERRLTVAGPLGGRVTYHDPCYLGRYNGEIESPRAVLDALGIENVEMERHGLRSSCCGGGGGAPLTDVPGKRRIPDLRMDHARATGAATVAVACPNCAVMLEGVVGQRPAVADIAELLLVAVEGQA